MACTCDHLCPFLPAPAFGSHQSVLCILKHFNSPSSSHLLCPLRNLKSSLSLFHHLWVFLSSVWFSDFSITGLEQFDYKVSWFIKMNKALTYFRYFFSVPSLLSCRDSSGQSAVFRLKGYPSRLEAEVCSSGRYLYPWFFLSQCLPVYPEESQYWLWYMNI